MRKRIVLFLIIPIMVIWLSGSGFARDANWLLSELDIKPDQGSVWWDLPFQYAQTSWPTIHRDSRNSNYLPFTTSSKLKPKWHALEGEYSAVITPPVIGPEGHIYFTTGREEEYGNLHAFDWEGNELWRSYLPDGGAFGSSPLIDRDGDLYLADLDEFFSFHSDGSLKWKCSIDGPFASTVFSLDGHIIGINVDGQVYALDPRDGRMAAPPLDLPGPPPGEFYRIPAPPGLWKGMVNENGPITVSEAFNGLMGYRFKITNTPVVNPANGRIYILGSVKSADRGSVIQGRFYGIDFVPGKNNKPGELRLVFQSKINAGSGSSPAISADGRHIYALDGAGVLHAFDKNGERVWKLHVGTMPASPTIGPDGTIYCVSGSALHAIKDSGDSGTIAWELDFTDAAAKKLSDSPSPWIEKFSSRKVKPTVNCNSVVSSSKNHLYLTLSAGYEISRERGNIPLFLPLQSLLVVVSPPGIAGVQRAKISSIIELPDTNEGILTLDKSGTVFCSHASIATSSAYYIAQRMMGAEIDFPRPIGGVTVLVPEGP
ncbi:MAG: PQQ-binding-like beta-propeller repeat protein [bacterium]